MNIDITKFNSISFALDGVLIDEFDGEINTSKEEMQKLLLECIKQGKSVSILSRRYAPTTETYPYLQYAKKAKKLTKEHKKEHKIADKIIKDLFGENINIQYTSRTPYSRYIRDSYKHCHIDSSEYEIKLINDYFSDVVKTINIKENDN